MMKKRGLAMLLMIQAGHAMAADDQQDKGFWYAQTSVYTKHYSPDPTTITSGPDWH
jgi:hypothetical protein